MTQTERYTGRVDDLSPSADRQAENTEAVLNQARRIAEQLHTALTVRATIDQAIGILISRGGGSPEEAAAALRDVSRSHGTDLGTVSRQIVEEVSRQAQTRHAHRVARRQGTGRTAGGRSTRGLVL
jgi:ANTAR domain